MATQQEWLDELSGVLGRRSVGNNNTVWMLELAGATPIEPTAFEPDPATHRGDYYYNARTNALYKKVITYTEPGIVHAYWQKVSDSSEDEDIRSQSLPIVVE